MSSNMTLIGRVRISKVTLKRHEVPGKIAARLVSEGTFRQETAYFKRTGPMVWERMSTLEYVRAIR